MKFQSRIKASLAALLAAVTLVGAPLAVYAGYAPANRPTYQCTTPTNCPGADHVVFNSFTNAPNYGDERAFFDGKDAGDTSAAGYLDSIPVHDGQKLTLRVYIHNNANPNQIGEAAATAHNTQMKVLLPMDKKASNFAAASISADNANPGNVSDTVDFTAGSPFTMDFDTTHAVQITYRPNGTGDFVTRTLPSATFGNANHSLTANFGDWKGCFNYAALVTMTVTIHMESQPPVTPAYSCDAFNITADVNRTVKVSTFATTATNGAVFKNAVINWGDNSTPLTTNNVVGQTHQYAKDGTYTISATAHFTVNGQDVTAGGPNCQKQVTFKGETPPTVTPPTTTPPSTLVNTGPGEVAALFAVATIGGAIAHRWMLGRRLSRQ
jgi:hypothetical protein